MMTMHGRLTAPYSDPEDEVAVVATGGSSPTQLALAMRQRTLSRERKLSLPKTVLLSETCPDGWHDRATRTQWSVKHRRGSSEQFFSIQETSWD